LEKEKKRGAKRGPSTTKRPSTSSPLQPRQYRCVPALLPVRMFRMLSMPSTLFFLFFYSGVFLLLLYLDGLSLWLLLLLRPNPLAFGALINSTLNLPSLSFLSSSSFPFSIHLCFSKNSIPTEIWVLFFFSFP